MDNIKNQVISKIQSSNAILITVGNSPNVDQLAGCIALTLMMNKLKKHGSAVFSGQVPSTIDFLDPQKNIEKNLDSLRDFIISFSKDKADKLKYKVEEDTVKIYITPYRTSLSEEDLIFSQGEFNIDLIITLGIKDKNDIDRAITAHGNILHDATIININLQEGSNLGNLNLIDVQASSYCELLTSISKSFDQDVLDEQIATALLTGIVSETDRFSNSKTTPQTMALSSDLMKAGANPQLISSKLEEEQDRSIDHTDDGLLGTTKPDETDDIFRIDHDSSNIDVVDSVNKEEELLNNDDQVNPLTQDQVNSPTQDQVNSPTQDQVNPPSPNQDNLAPLDQDNLSPSDQDNIAPSDQDNLPSPDQILSPTPQDDLEDKVVDTIKNEDLIAGKQEINQDNKVFDNQNTQPLPQISTHGESNLAVDSSVPDGSSNLSSDHSEGPFPEINSSDESVSQFSPPPASWDEELKSNENDAESYLASTSNELQPSTATSVNNNDSSPDQNLNTNLGIGSENFSVGNDLGSGGDQVLNSNNLPNSADQNSVSNQTGLDPSLFTETNDGNSFGVNDQAPPVPPPVVPFSFSDEN